jgi:CubicO group peptidase (beta-lactamase class C family)
MTRSNIASLSKGFTAMIIMMLAEKGKLQYDDPIVKYLPELKNFSNGITIRHLLTHTSGIPDVGDLGIDDSKLTNARAIKTLASLKSNFREPGQKYQYSNTGYLLLASIAERITKKKFSDYLNETILGPLDMKNTSLVASTTVGMGNMLSTVDDLFEWEESFYTEKLVRQSTLARHSLHIP